MAFQKKRVQGVIDRLFRLLQRENRPNRTFNSRLDFDISVIPYKGNDRLSWWQLLRPSRR